MSTKPKGSYSTSAPHDFKQLTNAINIDVDVVIDGAVDLIATFVIRVDDVKDKGGAHVQGAINDHVCVFRPTEER